VQESEQVFSSWISPPDFLCLSINHANCHRFFRRSPHLSQSPWGLR